jgi:UDP:flavonoid glycosyltransferase YjiC (YdhE family)
VDPAVISARDNVTVTRWVTHADVLPHCSAVITHGGHGTVTKALIADVPLVLVPLGRDQPDNADRVIYAGAGIRLRKNASARARQTTIGPVTDNPRYRAAARHMAARLASEREDNRAIDELEQVAAHGPATGHPAPREANG